MSAHSIVPGPASDHFGDGSNSFVGGVPRFPEIIDIPKCALCGAEMAFFLQIQLPKESALRAWGGRTILLFSCVSCADEDYLIPGIFSSEFGAGGVTPEFLNDYQINFKFYVSKGVGVAPYSGLPSVKFQPIEYIPCPDSAEMSKISGKPNWLMGDETPVFDEDGSKGTFLFQLLLDEEEWFLRMDRAKLQAELDLDGSVAFFENRAYKLFLNNRLFFFGGRDPHSRNIYVVSQI